MANVAALSGPTGAWRRVFRGAGPGRLADDGDKTHEECSDIFQSPETARGAGPGRLADDGDDTPEGYLCLASAL